MNRRTLSLRSIVATAAVLFSAMLFEAAVAERNILFAIGAWLLMVAAVWAQAHLMESRVERLRAEHLREVDALSTQIGILRLERTELRKALKGDAAP